jgi:hypothetical protein
MDARVLVIQTVDIRHKEQVIRLDHGGSDGRQGVIVAKFDFL